jgi:hypothetical protein
MAGDPAIAIGIDHPETVELPTRFRCGRAFVNAATVVSILTSGSMPSWIGRWMANGLTLPTSTGETAAALSRGNTGRCRFDRVP